MSPNLKTENILAPILLFAYNRPNHFKQALNALIKNKETKDSILYICIDGPRNTEDKINQKIMFDYIETIRTEFQNINIVKQNSNLGLAKNMIHNVTNIINKHDKLIVIEDDCVVSEAFLEFMNKALAYYEPHKKVWHISSHSWINDSKKINDVYLYRVMHCWGYGTWKDRWRYFEKDPQSLINQFTEQDIKRFNLDETENFWSQVLDNHSGHINTWAIFWYATIFKNNGLCMCPFYSYVENIGFDGSGTNCGYDKKYDAQSQLLNIHGKFNPQIDIEESLLAVNKIKKYYNDKSSNYNKFIKLVLSLLVGKKLSRKLGTLWWKIKNSRNTFFKR